MRIASLDELVGKRVVVVADCGTLGYMVAQRHLDVRRIGATGIVGSWVPGHGGDVVWVQHDDRDEVGVYCHLNELEFYSDDALKFALDKLTALRLLEEQRRPIDERIKAMREKQLVGSGALKDEAK